MISYHFFCRFLGLWMLRLLHACSSVSAIPFSGVPIGREYSTDMNARTHQRDELATSVESKSAIVAALKFTVKIRHLRKTSSQGETEKALAGLISSIHMDFDVFDLLKITVFQAMMRIASRPSFQKNGDFVYSSGFCTGVHSPL